MENFHTYGLAHHPQTDGHQCYGPVSCLPTLYDAFEHPS